MAEDQGVNGTIWNKEAIEILSLFGWDTIGDIDMDVVGDDSKKYGIDTFLKYVSPLKDYPQCAILEAKRYATTSLKKEDLQDWINRLDKKLSALKYSEEASDKFPALKECSTLDLGIIAIWFHDVDNYKSYQPRFIEILKEIKTSNKPRRSGGHNKVLVISNMEIMKLCSLDRTIKDYISDTGRTVNFYYPSIQINDKPIIRSKVLTPEYILSKVILAEAKSDKGIEENIVFYFGEPKTSSFQLLRNTLIKCSFLDNEKPIKLYIYIQTDELRKTQPEIERIFDDISFSMRPMENQNDLPANIKKISYE